MSRVYKSTTNLPFTVGFNDITWHPADEPPKEDLYGALVIPRGWEYAVTANYQAEDDADFKAGWYGSHRTFDFDVLEPIDAFAWANIDYNAILGWWAFYEAMGWPIPHEPR